MKEWKNLVILTSCEIPKSCRARIFFGRLKHFEVPSSFKYFFQDRRTPFRTNKDSTFLFAIRLESLIMNPSLSVKTASGYIPTGCCIRHLAQNDSTATCRRYHFTSHPNRKGNEVKVCLPGQCVLTPEKKLLKSVCQQKDGSNIDNSSPNLQNNLMNATRTNPQVPVHTCDSRSQKASSVTQWMQFLKKKSLSPHYLHPSPLFKGAWVSHFLGKNIKTCFFSGKDKKTRRESTLTNPPLASWKVFCFFLKSRINSLGRTGVKG